MEHLSEESLVAHYFGDDGLGRDAAEQHLAGCGECRARMAGLRELLDAIEAPQAPQRGEAYGEEVWNRIRAHLPEPERRDWRLWLPPRWAIGAAVAVLIIAAFLAGRFLQFGPKVTDVAKAPVPEKIRERVLLIALGDHLEKSQMVLVELANAPTTDGEVDISAERQRAEDLVDGSRLYRQTARQVGDNAMAKVLDELERTLLDIAHSPSQISQADLKRIQQRIESQGLIFKVRVVGSKVQRERRPQENTGGSDSNQQPQPRNQT